MPQLKARFKIHGLDSVDGLTNTSNTNKFYETYAEAHEMAERCLARTDRKCTGIVIFRAIAVIKPEHPPTKTYYVDETGGYGDLP